MGQLSATHEHSCAVLDGGYVQCWGAGYYEQLGKNLDSTLLPVLVMKEESSGDHFSGATQVAVGTGHSCAIVEEFDGELGVVFCWGGGQTPLGDNTVSSSTYPIRVRGVGNIGYLSGIKQLGAGSRYTCALSESGEVFCWGRGDRGELGDGNSGSGYQVLVPTPVVDRIPVSSDDTASGDDTIPAPVVDINGQAVNRINGIRQISVGRYHSCALKENGEVLCWGRGDRGQLGDGNEGDGYRALVPVSVVDINGQAVSGIKQIGVGRYHNCALKESGEALCWGYGGRRALGNGIDGGITPTPVDVLHNGQALSGIQQISAGIQYTCAVVLRNGERRVLCWGGGVNAPRLGWIAGPDGSGLLTGVQQVVTADAYSCVMVDDSGRNRRYCWGNRSKLGAGYWEGLSVLYSPIEVVDAFGSFAEKISAGEAHTCALTDEEGASCWGRGQDGALGNGFEYQSGIPVDTVRNEQGDLWSHLLQVSSGKNHTCALKNDSGVGEVPKVYCWGSGANGRLGNNSTTNSSIPVKLARLNPIPNQFDFSDDNSGFYYPLQVSAGAEHTCIVRVGGRVLCWGVGTDGRLGTGNEAEAWVPTEIVGDNRDFVQVSGGGAHTCALKSDGTAFCWGKNDKGQLGNNSVTPSSSPVAVLVDADADADQPLNNIQQISAGLEHTCAVKKDGGVLCWGEGILGRLGYGSDSRSSLPVTVLESSSDIALSGVTQVSAGDYHSCAVGDSGSVYCWGYGVHGQLGRSSANNSMKAVSVHGVLGSGNLTQMSQVSAGGLHTCALAGDSYQGDADYICWGRSDMGQVAHGLEPYDLTSTFPREVVGSGEVVEEVVEETVEEVVEGAVEETVEGAVEEVPEEVTPLFTEKITSGGGHTCALMSNEGEIHCWGLGMSGQLGDGLGVSSDRPIAVRNENGSHLTGMTQVSSGNFHTCGLSSDEKILCWGYGGDGQLGHAQNTDAERPKVVKRVSPDDENTFTPLISVVQVSSGENHTCALIRSGKVFCWGRGGEGRLGNGGNNSLNFAEAVMDESEPLNGIIQISLGGSHSCALSYNGRVLCWGAGSSGQLGNQATLDSNTPVVVVDSSGSTLFDIVQVSSARVHTCALKESGEVLCWGRGSGGRLGLGTEVDQMEAHFVKMEDGSSISNISQISSGWNHTCALNSDGKAFCWGYGRNGRLGSGSKSNELAAVAVMDSDGSAALDDIAQIGAGASHTCALKENRKVVCWGYGGSGRLGRGDSSGSLVAQSVLNAGGKVPEQKAFFKRISAGEAHTCVTQEAFLGTQGKAFCWGYGGDGQLGNNATANSSAPVQVGSLTTVQQVDTGNEFSCALMEDGGIYCWGRQAHGQLGNGVNTNSLKKNPVAVVGLGGQGVLVGAKQLSVGSEHSCVVSSGDKVFCWGKGTDGQLGQDTSIQASENPVKVVGVGGVGFLSNVQQVSAGMAFSCALKTDNTVFCWGKKSSGQLGYGVSGSGIQYTPVQVQDIDGSGLLSGVEQISAGNKHTCALQYNGKVVCWGFGGEGRLGNGDDLNANAVRPVQVIDPTGGSPLNLIVQVRAGKDHTCALNDVGSAYCWGKGSDYQLGHNSTASSNLPVRVKEGNVSLNKVKEITAGSSHTCALKEGGQIVCWGLGTSGRLGHDATSSASLPVVVKAKSGTNLFFNLTGGFLAEDLGSGYLHNCILNRNKTVECWGEGSEGQLGSGGISKSHTSIPVVDSTGSGRLTDIIQIAAGDFYTCALAEGKKVLCWGEREHGNLGAGQQTNSSHPMYVENTVGVQLSNIHQVAAGRLHTCALKNNSKVLCWGLGYNGQLGRNSTINSSNPELVKGEGGNGTLSSVQQISLGSEFSCALKTSGEVRCWGKNIRWQLGDNSSSDRLLPVPVIDTDGSGHLSDIEQIDAGDLNVCALKGDGRVVCWGRRTNGRRGEGDDSSGNEDLIPSFVVNVSGSAGLLSGIQQVSVGASHTCAIKSSKGRVVCWGGNNYGELGHETSASFSATPLYVQSKDGSGSLTEANRVSIGSQFSCALKNNGKVFCWGSSSRGKLGRLGDASNVPTFVNGSNEDSSIPFDKD